MKLYKIIFTHYGPKDSETGIRTYAIANDDEQVMRVVDKKYCYGAWQERDENMDDDYIQEYYDGERYLARMLRVKGECNDPDLEPQDLYYGATYYGWEVVDTNVHWLTIDVLIGQGIAEDWRDL